MKIHPFISVGFLFCKSCKEIVSSIFTDSYFILFFLASSLAYVCQTNACNHGSIHYNLTRWNGSCRFWPFLFVHFLLRKNLSHVRTPDHIRRGIWVPVLCTA